MCSLQVKEPHFRVKSQIVSDNDATGKLQPSLLSENIENLLICSALSTTQNTKPMTQISSLADHTYELKQGTHVAKLSILALEHTKYIRSVKNTLVRHHLKNNSDIAVHYFESLPKNSKPDEVNEDS